MQTKINRPTDPYSSQWVEYWRQNPGLAKGVGADAADDDDDNSSDGDDLTEDDPRVAKIVEGLKRKNAELLQKLQKKSDQRPETMSNEERDELKRLREAEEKRQEEEAKKRGEFDKIRQKDQERYEKERTELAKKAETYQQRYEREYVENRLLASLNAEKGEELLLMPHLKSRVRYEETDDGGQRLVVLDADGQQMLGEKGEPATLKDLHEEFKRHDVLSRAYPADRIPGTGSRPNRSGAGVRNPWQKDTWNMTEQMRLLQENPALAEQLKQSAK